MALTAARSLVQNFESGRPMPRIEALAALYDDPDYRLEFRHGTVVMIAGRSGSQKSGFAMWLCKEWNLPTLYVSGDMSPFTASSRIASSMTGYKPEVIEQVMARGGVEAEEIIDTLSESKIQFCFGSPIRWRTIAEELDAYVELHNAFPEVVVIDNIMDFEGAEAAYDAQMAVMSNTIDMARDTGATTIVMHHASDKSWDAKSSPWYPPSRAEIKNGLSEKPELSLGVALDPNTLHFNIAKIKDRSGPQDPTGKRWKTIQCEPELTRFHPLGLRRVTG